MVFREPQTSGSVTEACHPSSLDCLETLEGYRLSFMDALLWRPYVQQVFYEYGWPSNEIQPGLAGTYPTFIVDRKRVIKFFGLPFNGEQSWLVEMECGELLRSFQEMPSVKIIASGSLTQQSGWHYLVFEFVPGTSIGLVYENVLWEDKLRLAEQMGTWLRRMHHLHIPGKSSLPRMDRKTSSGWVSERLISGLNQWPTHLARGVAEYLASHVYDRTGSVCFIHADLTRDHVLGKIIDEHWVTAAVIDFGDAMFGDIYYELAALHLDLFDCDKRLLQAFLESYGMSLMTDFVQKSMTAALMHQFDVIAPLFERKPDLAETSSIADLANRLWDLES